MNAMLQLPPNLSPTFDEIDLGVALFLFCGLVALLIAGASAIPMDTGAAGGFGFLIAIPLTLLSLAAMAMGALIALRRRHRVLLVLAALTLGFFAVTFFEAGPLALQKLSPAIYGGAVVLLCGAWAALWRRPTPPMNVLD